MTLTITKILIVSKPIPMKHRHWNLFLFIYLFILKVGVFRRDIINMCKMPSKNSLSKFL